MDMNRSIQEFERTRIQLESIENQNRNLKLQSRVIEEALKELKDTKEEKVYKAVGNILILKDAEKVQKELDEQKESIDLRIKTVDKQEQTTLDKLNKLKSEIEAARKGNEGDKDKEGQ